MFRFLDNQPLFNMELEKKKLVLGHAICISGWIVTLFMKLLLFVIYITFVSNAYTIPAQKWTPPPPCASLQATSAWFHCKVLLQMENGIGAIRVNRCVCSKWQVSFPWGPRMGISALSHPVVLCCVRRVEQLVTCQWGGCTARCPAAVLLVEVVVPPWISMSFFNSFTDCKPKKGQVIESNPSPLQHRFLSPPPPPLHPCPLTFNLIDSAALGTEGRKALWVITSAVFKEAAVRSLTDQPGKVRRKINSGPPGLFPTL